MPPILMYGFTLPRFFVIGLGFLTLAPGCLGVWPGDWRDWRSDHQDSAGADTDQPATADDADGDGFPAEDDCDDGDAAVNPGATEVCDSVDNDCDGNIDEADAADAPTWYLDADGDGYGISGTSTIACALPSGYAAAPDDCDDGDDDIHPGATEDCNGRDDDCDGTVDDDAALVVGSASYDTVQGAIDAAPYAGTVQVCPGRYFENLRITQPLELEGVAGSDLTVLDGSGDGAVFEVTSGDVTIRGLTLTNGSGFGSIYGGALYADMTGELTLDDLQVTNSNARFGGGIYVRSGVELSLRDVEITGNNAEYYGGGLALVGACSLASSTVISGNTADLKGGGVYCEGCTLSGDGTLVVAENSAPEGGGLLMNGEPSLSGCVVAENQATGSLGRGAGLSMRLSGGASGLVDATTITGNVATSSDGGLFLYSSTEGGTFTIQNSLITDNQAPVGGGIGIYGQGIPTVHVNESTITGNLADSEGGGGAYLYVNYALYVVGSDWGSGSSDNSPTDVELFSGSTYTDFGADESFTCQSSTGTCE